MDKIRIVKSELLKQLHQNRDAHLKIFEEALDGYKQQVIEQLEEQLANIRKGRVKQVYIHMPLPENHTKDYDRVIRMLEMSQDDEIMLSEQDFSSYVMDDWAWKRQFLTSNSTYSVTAAAQTEQYDL